MHATVRLTALLVLIHSGLSVPASAQRLGGQVSAEAFALGVGPRAELSLAKGGRFARAFLVTSLELVMAACDDDACVGGDINANIAVPLRRIGRGPYLGAGLGVREMPGNPEPVVNLLAGLRGRRLFGELRVNNETLVLTVGFLGKPAV